MGPIPGELVGAWKLVSFENEFPDGAARRAMFGANPTGYIIFTDRGRMMSIVEGEGRRVPNTPDEAAAAMRTMFAYTGVCRFEGDRWTTTVDVSWNPAWHGTAQVRSAIVTWERVR